MSPQLRIARRIALGLFLPIVIVLVYGSWSSSADNPFYPTLSVIGNRFQSLWLFSHVGTDVWPSLRNLIYGFFLACAAGVVVGTLLALSRMLTELFMPLIHFGRSVPPIMLIPPLVLVLGIGDPSKVAIISLGAFFPVLIATIDGMRNADPLLTDIAKSLQLTRRQTFLRIWIPAASPSIFGGMQSALQLSLVLMVSSEMVAAYRGIGYITMQAQLTFDAPTVWAGIVLLALLGFALNYVFVLVQRRALAWNYGLRAASKSR